MFGDMPSTSMMHRDGSKAQTQHKNKNTEASVAGWHGSCVSVQKISSRDRWNYSWPCMHADAPAAEAGHKHCGCCTRALSCTPASAVPLMNAQEEYSYIKHTSINLHAYVTPKPSPCTAMMHTVSCIPHSLQPAYLLQLLLLVNDITSLLLSHCCVFTAFIQRRIIESSTEN